MTKEELEKVLAESAKYWDTDGKEGQIADLRGAKLEGAKLRGANICEADIRWTHLG